jgi:hypothetical protein
MLNLRSEIFRMNLWNKSCSSINELLGCSKIYHTFKAAHTQSKTRVRAASKLPNLVALQEGSPIGQLRLLPVDPLDLRID